MHIFIPSSGRAHIQLTWNSLPEVLRKKTTLVVPNSQLQEYTRKGFPAIADPGVPRIGVVRQWIAEHAREDFVMLDDDLTFFMRRQDNPTLFKDATPQDIVEAFDDLATTLKTYAHASMGTREGGNRRTEYYIQDTRLLRVLGYNKKIFMKEKIRFDRLDVMEDFDVTLQLLTKGYSNMTLNYIVHNQKGSNQPGGCSLWRNPEMQEKGAYELHSQYPDFVRVVKKFTKTAWFKGERTDVVVQWKKARNSHG